MANHADLADAQLHELKGAAGASSGTVPVSNGSGSHTWTNMSVSNLSGLNNANLVYIQARIPDISTADIIYVPCPLAGDIVKVITVLESAIATDNGDVRLRIAGTPVTDSDVTITAASSAAGDVDTAVPTAANTVTADSAIEVQTQGNASTAAAVEVMIAIDVSS